MFDRHEQMDRRSSSTGATAHAGNGQSSTSEPAAERPRAGLVALDGIYAELFGLQAAAFA
jgi:hypothetical protein